MLRKNEARADVLGRTGDACVTGVEVELAWIRQVARDFRNAPVTGLDTPLLRECEQLGLVADLVSAGVSAGEITGSAARVVGGGGSRDPELAQAGGPKGDEIEAALEVAREAARTALQGATS